jgi:hypothetical protein
MRYKDEMEMPVGRFAFVMKAIAENDLWDEVVFQLEQEGLNKITFSRRQLDVVRAIIGQTAESGQTLTRRGHRFLRSGCQDGGGSDAGPDGGSDAGADAHPH